MPTTAVTQTEENEQTQAQQLLDAMSVEERIGQLFLVTFQGEVAGRESDVADLILNYFIGGLVLLAGNDNITGYGQLADVPFQVAQLSNELQQMAISGVAPSLPGADAPELEETVLLLRPSAPARVGVPLFIATLHEGDGYPHSQIFNGLTEIPNNMAIGATWRPESAQKVGEVVGRELSSLGINMLLGPSLDVLEKPIPFNASDMGSRTFGGDPYWVGLMGQAYTTGIHLGSNYRVAVVPKHFPGYGSSDRPLHEEVPTVRKSLEQLKQIELAPFVAVTGRANGQPAAADGLLTTHIRYQGFQGNIRATTNPVSFDPQALATLMSQDQFASWRQGGGLLVSDALGVRAIERFYRDIGQEFPHRQVAKDAFLAGNDLLYLAEFALGEQNYEAELANIKDTVHWFRERYRTDLSFQQQVDRSVLRILQLKLRLYDDDFSLQNVLVDAEGATAVVGQSQAAMFDVAQRAVTLISPSHSDLAERLPQPPGASDTIVIFTDVRQAQQCSYCPPQSFIAETALEERILALYGPEASGQVQPNQIFSFSFQDLQAFLDAGPGPIPLPTVPVTPTLTPTLENTAVAEDVTATSTPAATETPVPTPTPPPAYLVQEALRDADWIIFGMLDAVRGPRALSNFLASRSDMVRNTQVVVFAFNAPYYLDTTEISQLSAYFGIYSKTSPFIDASVRVLFQELSPAGMLPVNVEGIRYDLFTQTQPDPHQVIELLIIQEGNPHAPLSSEPLKVSVGDTLRLQTGVIRDRNGNPVPDDTLVRFIQRDRVEGLVNIIAEAPTRNGVALLDYVLEARTEAGQFQIKAESGEATVSLEINISVGTADAQISVATPIPSPTATPTATPTPSVTPSPTLPAPTPELAETPQTMTPGREETAVSITVEAMQTLLAVMSGLVVVSGTALAVGQRHDVAPSQKVGRALWGVVGALIFYNYYALGLPGAGVLAGLSSWAGLLTTLAGGILGLILYRLR